jgi:phospholipid-binding lipoprotein MlaA
MKIKTIIKIVVASLLFSLAGCACVDPLEPLNRQVFKFNMALDHVIFRPVARAYDAVVPAPVACSIGNFFDNLDDLTNIANNVLQLKFYDAWSDVWRFGFNSTFGVLGLFDVASSIGLQKHCQDFGLTLARYGIVRSPYLMVPIFGPTTLRDGIGWTVDWRYLSIWPYIEPKSLRYGLYGLRLIHKRALLLPADQLIDDSLDPYLFIRDAYLQKRNCEIKKICPLVGTPDETATASTAKGSDGDTFVAEDGNKTPETKAQNNKQPGPKPTKHSNSDDTFEPA